MSFHNVLNYCTRYFKYKTLDKITGQPNTKAIVKIFHQLKRNSQRVPTTLRGGELGYLTLLLLPADYNLIPGSASFNRLSDPGTFIPINPEGSNTRTAPVTPITTAEIATQKVAYDKRKRLYNKVQVVKTSLRIQVIEAINAEYLEPLRRATADMINDSIPVIFIFLRVNYGRITPGLV